VVAFHIQDHRPVISAQREVKARAPIFSSPEIHPNRALLAGPREAGDPEAIEPLGKLTDLELLLGEHAAGDKAGVQGHGRKTPVGRPGSPNIRYRRRKDPTPGTIWA